MGEAVAGVHDPAVISICSPHLQEMGMRGGIYKSILNSGDLLKHFSLYLPRLGKQ